MNAPLSFSPFLPLSKLSKGQRGLLHEAWDWLDAEGFPFDVKPQSVYLFAAPTEVDKPVGIVELRNYDADKWAWVQILYVRPEHRRQSYGRQLLQRTIEHCRRPGTQMGLGTSMGNTPMQILAVQCGLNPRSDFWINWD